MPDSPRPDLPRRDALRRLGILGDDGAVAWDHTGPTFASGVIRVRAPIHRAGQDPDVVAEFQWEGPGEEWHTTGDVRVTAKGSLVLGSLCLLPRPGAGRAPSGLTSEVLRAIRTGTLLDDVQRWLAHESAIYEARGAFGTPHQPEAAEVARVDSATTAERPRGRRGWGAAHYRQVAADCLDLQARGVTRGMRAALAAQWSERLGYFVSPETVRDWIKAARSERFQFLAPAQAGRTGVSPGAKYQEESL